MPRGGLYSQQLENTKNQGHPLQDLPRLHLHPLGKIQEARNQMYETLQPGIGAFRKRMSHNKEYFSNPKERFPDQNPQDTDQSFAIEPEEGFSKPFPTIEKHRPCVRIHAQREKKGQNINVFWPDDGDSASVGGTTESPQRGNPHMVNAWNTLEKERLLMSNVMRTPDKGEYTRPPASQTQSLPQSTSPTFKTSFSFYN